MEIWLYLNVLKKLRNFFILPIRNGNLALLKRIEEVEELFYPTYEEWKQEK